MADPLPPTIRATSLRGVELLGDETLLRDLLAFKPDHVAALTRLGQILCRTNRFDEAALAIGQALQHDPECADAHSAMGEILLRQNKTQDAVVSFNKALQINPQHGGAALNLGRMLLDHNQNPQAAQALLIAVRALPTDAPAHLAFAMALTRLGKQADAMRAFAVAAKGEPPVGDILNNQGVAMDGTGRKAEAITLLRAAVLLTPESWTAWDNLGNALLARGNARMAESCHRQALAIKPGNPSSLSNLANALHRQGRMEESVAYYREAIAAEPNSSKFHTNLALTLLLMGRFEEGWREYEWRWQLAEMTGARRNFSQPQWRGEDAVGKTILIHAEQGFGDTLQFVRYAPMVAEKGLTVVLEVQRPLVRLMRSLPGIAQVLAKGDPLPDFDLHCPMMSLPLAFDTRLGTVPSTPAYLSADPDDTQAWADRMAAEAGDAFKVGLVWAGNPRRHSPDLAAIDRKRSMAPDLLAPLAAIEGVRCYSLQKDGPSAPPTMPLIDHMGEMDDFAATAALVANLDLVITVDTAVAHLAAGLGRPVWILDRFDSCWRWLRERADSPWYPSVRLLRQTKPGDWSDVVDAAVRDLQALVSSSRADGGRRTRLLVPA
jgi:Flp pilus assembly protein TadD